MSEVETAEEFAERFDFNERVTDELVGFAAAQFRAGALAALDELDRMGDSLSIPGPRARLRRRIESGEWKP